MSSWQVRSAAAVLLLLAIIAGAAPLLAPEDPGAIHLEKQLLPPGGGHLLGTDTLGRCLFSRLLYGLRNSLLIAAAVLSARVFIGILVGILSTYSPGPLALVLRRLIDLELAFPGIVTPIVIVGMLGPGVVNLTLSLAVVGWSKYARLMGVRVASLKEKEFIEGARSYGTGDLRIIVRHILPNAIWTLAPLVSLGMGGLLIHIGGLSFLGLGLKPGTPELGMIIRDGYAVFPGMAHLVLLPSLLIFIIVLGMTVLSDGMRDVYDPRTRT